MENLTLFQAILFTGTVYLGGIALGVFLANQTKNKKKIEKIPTLIIECGKIDIETGQRDKIIIKQDLSDPYGLKIWCDTGKIETIRAVKGVAAAYESGTNDTSYNVYLDERFEPGIIMSNIARALI